MTLIDQVAKYLLRYRKITAVKAYALFGTMRLSSIISELRKKGWPIETEYVETVNRWGQKIRHGIYVLKKNWNPKTKKYTNKRK